MSPLHIVYSSAGFSKCIERLGSDDTVILLGDAVYLSETTECAALAPDLVARGLTIPATAFDYEKFVDLTVAHYPIVSWP